MEGYDRTYRPRLRTAKSAEPFDSTVMRPLDFGKVFNRDNLFRVFKNLKTKDRAPGIDGIRFSDISEAEGAENCGRLADLILGDAYQPGRTLKHPIPKGEDDVRMLAIPTTMDHVAARATHEALCPYAEAVFSDRSYGYRPKRTLYQLLARVVTQVNFGQCPAIGSYDITRAFDTVRIDSIMESFDKLFGEAVVQAMRGRDQWAKLLRTIITDGTDRKLGIGTGNPFSPLALNVAIHYVLDSKLTDTHAVPWLRWADNIIFVTDNLKAVQKARSFAELRLRRLGFSLHGDSANLLKGDSASLLGFDVRLSGRRVIFMINEKSWVRLEKELPSSHDFPDPPTRLQETLRGWLNAYGPALRSAEGAIDRLMEIARQTTCLVPDRSDLAARARQAYRRWERLLRHTLPRGDGAPEAS